MLLSHNYQRELNAPFTTRHFSLTMANNSETCKRKTGNICNKYILCIWFVVIKEQFAKWKTSKYSEVEFCRPSGVAV